VVDDNEQLYRRVLKEHYTVEGGVLRISSQAFSDRRWEPSVDRARLREFDPRRTQVSADSGVVSIVARDVRAITQVTRQQDNVTTVFMPDPIEDPISASQGVEANPAHAVIVTNPRIPNGSTFRKLLEALSYLANKTGWVLPPAA